MTMRQIDISNLDPVDVSAASLPRPDLAWIRISRIYIDDRYQRDLGPSNWQTIRRIAATFDWALFTPVTVSIQPGAATGQERFALIDGQHRVHAAALVGLHLVPALIVSIPPEAQAAAFAGINSMRTSVSALGLFKAALVAGEEWALEAYTAVSVAGCRLMTYNKSTRMKKPREIFSVALVRDHVLAGRAKVVSAGLRAISESSRGDDVGLYAQRVLRPWLGALGRQEQFIDIDLSRFVSTVDLQSLIDRATTDRPRGCVESDYQLAMGAILAALEAFARGDRSPGLQAARSAKRPAIATTSAKRTVSAPPARERWNGERDQRLMESGGRYRELTALAEEWGLSFREVQARWHLVRRVA